MKRPLKIAIIGDFNFSYNAHHATNIAIEHASVNLGLNTDYYWLRLHEMSVIKLNDLKKHDGIWLAPGPYDNEVFLHEIMKLILSANLPLLVTGRGFRVFVEVINKQYNIDSDESKVISENLFQGDQYDRITVIPILESLRKLYGGKSREELSNSRFSIYPQTIEDLLGVIDVEALNQFDEPEIISLKSREFCVATMSLPQITSTRESPHPLISAFLNYIRNTVK